VRRRYARCCRPAGVEGHITCKRIVSEAGRSRVRPSAYELFAAENEVLLYDAISTYFEGQAERNLLALDCC
jgi:hypothetical protein